MSEQDKNSANTSEPNATKAPAQHKAKTTKNKSRWPLFALAFILGNAAAFFAFKLNLEHHFLNIPMISQTQPVEPATPQPTVQKTASTPISSEEGAALISAITELQQHIQAMKTELQTLRDRQAQANQAQNNIETMQLHARLAWITKPTSHLPQITLAWQEISLMPSLSKAQRAKAESMFTLAQQRSTQVLEWKQELEQISHMLKPSEHNNIIPEQFSSDASNPWLAWFGNQFSLKRSQSRQEKDIAALRQRLKRIQHDMDIEQWPSGTSWTQLRAQLQLYLVNTSDLENPILQLPESFSAIQDDIQELRSTAHDWLEEL